MGARVYTMTAKFPGPTTAEQSGPWSSQFEDDCQAQVRLIVGLPQASADKKRAFSKLLSVILAPLDRFTRRSWLPEDEAANVTLAVIARLERENFKNLQEFVRRADLE